MVQTQDRCQKKPEERKRIKSNIMDYQVRLSMRACTTALRKSKGNPQCHHLVCKNIVQRNEIEILVPASIVVVEVSASQSQA